jgi:hypothetical protein
MKLIDEWTKAWRMLSVQAMTLAGALQGAWVAVPDDLRSQVPSGLVHWITIGLLALGLVGRVVKQDKVSGGDK